MPGLVPGIHVLRAVRQLVDGRDKPGHDDVAASVLPSVRIICEPGHATRAISSMAPAGARTLPSWMT